MSSNLIGASTVVIYACLNCDRAVENGVMVLWVDCKFFDTVSRGPLTYDMTGQVHLECADIFELAAKRVCSENPGYYHPVPYDAGR